VKNDVEIRAYDSIFGHTMPADWARRYVQELASGAPKEVTQS
jgi:hypothetical protein